eukprot:2889099-Rhodomonas_salina.1
MCCADEVREIAQYLVQPLCAYTYRPTHFCTEAYAYPGTEAYAYPGTDGARTVCTRASTLIRLARQSRYKRLRRWQST